MKIEQLKRVAENLKEKIEELERREKNEVQMPILVDDPKKTTVKYHITSDPNTNDMKQEKKKREEESLEKTSARYWEIKQDRRAYPDQDYFDLNGPIKPKDNTKDNTKQYTLYTQDGAQCLRYDGVTMVLHTKSLHYLERMTLLMKGGSIELENKNKPLSIPTRFDVDIKKMQKAINIYDAINYSKDSAYCVYAKARDFIMSYYDIMLPLKWILAKN